MRLEGKVALITGGASGMGMVAVEAVRREGAEVVLTDVADDAGEATAAEITDTAEGRLRPRRRVEGSGRRIDDPDDGRRVRQAPRPLQQRRR